VLEARVVITNWVESYNASHPHRSLGMMSPNAFAAAALAPESKD
jgi:transposase InsO family protein